MGSVVEGTKAFGPGMGKGSGTTGATGEEAGEGEGEGEGEGIGVGVGVSDEGKVGEGVWVAFGMGLGVAEGIGKSAAVGGGELRGTEARAAMAGVSAISGRPTIHPVTATSKNNKPSAGSLAAACCALRRCREGPDAGRASHLARAVSEGRRATRRHAHRSAA
jgi:hypothetical protein